MTTPRRTLAAAALIATGASAMCASCASPARVVSSSVHASPPPAPPTRLPRDWGIPGFFEIGGAVELTPGAGVVDTRGWLETLLEKQRTQGSDAADPEGNVFVYAEPDSGTGTLRRYALVLPETEPFSSNGQVVAHWSETPEAFNFGLDRARSFGSLLSPDAGGDFVVRSLKARFAYSGTNVQDAELVYDVEGTPLAVAEHKGLVPGVPMSFERFVVYDRATIADDQEPAAVSAEASPVTMKIGLSLRDHGTWRTQETFDVEGRRVVYLTDSRGDHYFLAASASLSPEVYFGGISGDRVVEATLGAAAGDGGQTAGALIVRRATAGTIFSGKVRNKEEVAADSRVAATFLENFDGAMKNLRSGEDRRAPFLRFYAHAFLDSHRSRHDPRAVTELPYGDSYYPTNVRHASGNVWFGSDQASVIEGLVAYVRRSGDRSVLGTIGGLADSSIEAMTPTGSVWMKHFDEMLLTTETDPNTARRDAFIDNGGVSVSFNHTRMVVRRGYERIAGVTWGAFEPVISGRAEPVDDGNFSFALDPASLPPSVATDRDALSVTRLFTRRDGAVRVRETAAETRGLPSARIGEEVENVGHAPLAFDEARVTVGDFFHYGDGINEITQNRYGFSRVFEGVPLHVGFWMEGLTEPLWGDDAPAGWVDVTATYKQHKSRFLAVYGYDKAELYHLPKEADAVLLYNAGPGASKDGYHGWTALQVRYKVAATLAPGATYAVPPVDTYPLWAPLYSADDDAIPDELQALAPLWTELVETLSDDPTPAARAEHLRSLPDRGKAERLGRLLHTSIESDYAYAGMQAAWMDTADLFRDLAKSAPAAEKREFARHAEEIRAAALRGAEFSLRTMTQLRNRFDLMPAFGIMRYYGFHVAVFDWAYRETCDPRYRDAMLYVADRIATSDRQGGLQVTDPSKPNYGGYVINEFSRAAGANNLDDQGIKLWALRIAFERTGDPKYQRSAELCIDHWVHVRPADHLFYGITKLFNQYVPTGLDQQRTPYGHYSLLVGLESWADRHPRARELYELGLKNATERHGIHSVGTTGAYYMAFPDEGLVQYGTNAELGGTFLWAMSFDVARLHAPSATCAPASGDR